VSDASGGTNGGAPELDIVETPPAGPPDAEGIHGRPPRPPVRWSLRPGWVAGLLALVLAVGIGVGYLVMARFRIVAS
jgi:hypothetical protein